MRPFTFHLGAFLLSFGCSSVSCNPCKSGSWGSHAAMCLSRVQLGGGTPITITPGMSVNMKAPLERSGRLSLIYSVSLVYFNLFLFAFYSVIFFFSSNCKKQTCVLRPIWRSSTLWDFPHRTNEGYKPGGLGPQSTLKKLNEDFLFWSYADCRCFAILGIIWKRGSVWHPRLEDNCQLHWLDAFWHSSQLTCETIRVTCDLASKLSSLVWLQWLQCLESMLQATRGFHVFAGCRLLESSTIFLQRCWTWRAYFLGLRSNKNLMMCLPVLNVLACPLGIQCTKPAWELWQVSFTSPTWLLFTRKFQHEA